MATDQSILDRPIKHSQISVYTFQSDYAFKYLKELQRNLQMTSGEYSILIEIILFHSPNVIKSLKKEYERVRLCIGG